MEEEKNFNIENKEPKKKKGSAAKIIIILIIICAICAGGCFAYTKFFMKKDENVEKKEQLPEQNKTMEIEDNTVSKEKIEEGKLSDFDLSFLKEENKDNMIYSPLSIKYCLKMLQEASDGETAKQIEKILGDYELPTYRTSKNLSLANSFFVKNEFKESILAGFISNLQKNYAAEVQFDSFTSPDAVNKWIADKTFNIIPKMLDSIDPSYQFFVINALAIDMDWNNKFLNLMDYDCSYAHEKFGWTGSMDLTKLEFDNGDEVSAMEVQAAINNYDIVKELGEDEIRKTVTDEFIKYFSKPNVDEYECEEFLGSKTTAGVDLKAKAEEYCDKYIKEINENYHNVTKTTDFRYYVDDEVKIFSKDLKKYDGTSLEYIGIMPVKEDLSKFINSIDANKINSLVGNLKDISVEDSKDGVITYINGNIPKFKYEYNLNLLEDLKKLGIKDIFEQNKADLSKMTSEKGLFIGDVLHKANIEFTQDGIKAAAATIAGGLGAGDFFDYYFDVPVETIDITFDKPYMYVIRDKDNGEVWFVGCVNDPLKYSEDESVAYRY